MALVWWRRRRCNGDGWAGAAQMGRRRRKRSTSRAADVLCLCHGQCQYSLSLSLCIAFYCIHLYMYTQYSSILVVRDRARDLGWLNSTYLDWGLLGRKAKKNPLRIYELASRTLTHSLTSILLHIYVYTIYVQMYLHTYKYNTNLYLSPKLLKFDPKSPHPQSTGTCA